ELPGDLAADRKASGTVWKAVGSLRARVSRSPTLRCRLSAAASCDSMRSCMCLHCFITTFRTESGLGSGNLSRECGLVLGVWLRALGLGTKSGLWVEAAGARAPATPPCYNASMVKMAHTWQPSSVLSSGLPTYAQTQESLLPVQSNETRSVGLENDVRKIIRPRRENGQVKATDTATRRNISKSHKPLSKLKSEEELKAKNQLSKAINKQLHQKLTETQGELKDLTQKAVRPWYHTYLDSTTDHMDSTLLLETLQDELKLFNETVRKQMEEL
ncbi:hypothetical protein Celaphus_00002183, partial [Cervus elaphus hippelaphus]